MPYNVEALKELSKSLKELKPKVIDAKARMKARLAEKAKKSKKQESSSESEEEERKEYKQPKLTKKNAMKARTDFKTIDGQKHVETNMVIRKGLTPSEKHALQQSIFHAVEHHLAGSGLVIDVDGMYNNHPYTDHIHSSKIYFTSDSESDNERPTAKTIAKRRGRPPNIQEPISRLSGGGFDLGNALHNVAKTFAPGQTRNITRSVNNIKTGAPKIIKGVKQQFDNLENIAQNQPVQGRGRGRPRKIVC